MLLLHQAKDCKTSIKQMDESLGDYFKSLFFQVFPEDVDCIDDQFNDSSFEPARQLRSPLVYNRPVLDSTSMASLRAQSGSSSMEVIRHPSGTLSALAGGKGSTAAARGRAVYAEMNDVPRSARFEEHSEKTCADLKAQENCCFPKAVQQAGSMLDQLKNKMKGRQGVTVTRDGKPSAMMPVLEDRSSSTASFTPAKVWERCGVPSAGSHIDPDPSCSPTEEMDDDDIAGRSWKDRTTRVARTHRPDCLKRINSNLGELWMILNAVEAQNVA